MARLRMPDNMKLFGVNIVPTPADVAPSSGQLAWVNMFKNWDWNGWVKPQVDYLCGNGIGANCVRMIGAQEGVITGQFSQDYHDSKIEQLATYCRSLGVYYFLCTGGVQQPLVTAIGSGLQPRSLAAVQIETMKRMSALDNVIGCDLIQEAQSGSIGNSFLIPMVQQVRAAGIDLPITCSASMVNTATGVPTPGPTGENWLLNVPDGRMGQYFDFLAVHLYFRSLDSSWFQQFFSAFPEHDIIIGEFGRSLADGSALQIADYNRYFDMGDAPDRRVRGALAWAATDQDTVTTNQWGLYTGTFTPREWILATLREHTLGSVAKNNAAVR